nr:MAG TPA: hypothetical protein [Caudoviricetes sp.]
MDFNNILLPRLKLFYNIKLFYNYYLSLTC